MRVRCDRLNLVDRLSAIQGIVPSTTPKPILGDFLLKTEGGQLLAQASDLQLSGRVVLPKVEVMEAGELALPSARLLAILKEISEDAIEIRSIQEPPGAELRSPHFQFKILGHDPAEFPQLEKVEGALSVQASHDKLLECLRRVGVAASRDASRYHLNGVFFEFAKGKLTLTATDGKRLAHDHIRIDDESGVEVSAIVPNAAVDVFQKVLGSQAVSGGEDKVTLRIADTRLALETPQTRIATALIEGQYPNYRLAFQPEMKVRARVKRQELLSAARGAAITTDKLTQSVRFRLGPQGLSMEATAKDIGESRVEIPIEIEGGPIEMSLNPTYLIDALRVFDEDELRLELSTPDKPAQLRGSGSYLHLVVPVVGSRA